MWKRIILFTILFVVAIITFNVLGYFGQVVTVVKKEVAPQVLLNKYEWFKDASHQLEKKRRAIINYQARLKDIEDSMSEIKRHEWPRAVQETYSMAYNEYLGIKSSYNSLAAQYNSQSSKINWKFMSNKDEIPQQYKRLE